MNNKLYNRFIKLEDQLEKATKDLMRHHLPAEGTVYYFETEPPIYPSPDEWDSDMRYAAAYLNSKGEIISDGGERLGTIDNLALRDLYYLATELANDSFSIRNEANPRIIIEA